MKIQRLQFSIALVLLLLCSLVLTLSSVYAQEEEADVPSYNDMEDDDDEIVMEDEPAIVEETVTVEEVIPEPVVEPVAEPEPVEEEPVAAEEESTKDVDSTTSTEESGGTGPLTKLKNTVQDTMKCCLDKCKTFVDRCKNMSKNDMKKVAAAALGIWGIGAGIGWLVQSTGTPRGSGPSGIGGCAGTSG